LAGSVCGAVRKALNIVIWKSNLNQARVIRLTNLLSSEEASLPALMAMTRSRASSLQRGALLSSIATRSETRGLVAYFLNGDVQAFKQHFYVAARLHLLGLGEPGGPTLEFGKELFLALMSDNSEVIRQASEACSLQMKQHQNNPALPWFTTKMWQHLVRGEYAEVKEMRDSYASSMRAPEWQQFAARRDFFSLIRDRDKPNLESLLRKHAELPSDIPVWSDWMNFRATMEAKLCWRLGIDVNVDSAMIPNALLPVEPLHAYEDEYPDIHSKETRYWTGLIRSIFGRSERQDRVGKDLK
jgi:hypothetical protein